MIFVRVRPRISCARIQMWDNSPRPGGYCPHIGGMERPRLAWPEAHSVCREGTTAPRLSVRLAGIASRTELMDKSVLGTAEQRHTWCSARPLLWPPERRRPGSRERNLRWSLEDPTQPLRRFRIARTSWSQVAQMLRSCHRIVFQLIRWCLIPP